MGSTIAWLSDFLEATLEYGILEFIPKPLWDRCGDAIKRVIESYKWEIELNEYGQPLRIVSLEAHAHLLSNMKVI